MAIWTQNNNVTWDVLTAHFYSVSIARPFPTTQKTFNVGYMKNLDESPFPFIYRHKVFMLMMNGT
jgi:hypothetical protein